MFSVVFRVSGTSLETLLATLSRLLFFTFLLARFLSASDRKYSRISRALPTFNNASKANKKQMLCQGYEQCCLIQQPDVFLVWLSRATKNMPISKTRYPPILSHFRGGTACLLSKRNRQEDNGSAGCDSTDNQRGDARDPAPLDRSLPTDVTWLSELVLALRLRARANPNPHVPSLPIVRRDWWP